MTILSKRVSQSLQFNQISWNVSRLGESVLLLESKGISIDQVHSSTHLAKKVLGSSLVDIVPSYTSIALFHQPGNKTILEKLSSQQINVNDLKASHQKIEMPICYELGLDLEALANHAGHSREELITRHLGQTYSAVLIGFTPGFIYLGGMDASLSCPRRSSPRKQLEAGSVGIGGSQTGIYSLNSPGGWNIIGRTPLPLFDIEKQPPLAIEIGTEVRFKRISKKEFERWEN